MFEFHPFADLFRMMNEEEYAGHLASIKKSGLNHAILLYEGKILDGRNRYQACLEAGVEPRFEEFHGDHQAAIERVLADNRDRRHPTKVECAIAAERAANLIQGGDRKSQDRRLDRAFDPTSSIELGATAGSKEGVEDRPVSIAQAALAAGASVSDVKKVRAIKTYAPELLDEVQKGKKALDAALGVAAKKRKEKVAAKAASKGRPAQIPLANKGELAMVAEKVGKPLQSVPAQAFQPERPDTLRDFFSFILKFVPKSEYSNLKMFTGGLWMPAMTSALIRAIALFEEEEIA